MQTFLQKFNETYKGKKFIEIEFFNDTPLTKKYVRYNQSGDVCHCLEGQTTGSQKTKNGWQPIQCDTVQCQHRQKNENGKTACNRIGWLKFLIPSICKDRIWLMRITSQTSINRIDDYINLQRVIGNSLKGRYILFLKQEEQEKKSTGQKFNNYVLDILKKEDFSIEQTNSPIIEKANQVSTNTNQNVNNNVVNQEKTVNTAQNIVADTPAKEKNTTSKTAKKTTTTKDTSKKETKSKSKKTEEQNIDEFNSTETKKDEYENYYILESTFTDTITDKSGNTKEYLVGKFYNMQDQPFNIVVRPEHATELQECDLGTIVELDIKDVLGRKFAMNLKFIDKRTKKLAA